MLFFSALVEELKNHVTGLLKRLFLPPAAAWEEEK